MHSQTVHDRLTQGVELVKDVFPRYEKRIRKLIAHLEKGRINVAVLGQFKRGKSTLLNAIISEELLPSSVIPLTAIPTFLLGGTKRMARILFTDDRPPLTLYDEIPRVIAAHVTERDNPENIKGVKSVRITLDHPLLREGVTLIDTPGIGSLFTHNTQTTLAFLSKCDAALFVISPDPPITEVEMAFLKEVRERVPHLYFIVNKADLLSSADREEFLAFTRETLRQHMEKADEVPLFVLSAKKGLKARREGSDEAWRESGMATLMEDLFAQVVEKKTTALIQAVEHRLEGVVSQLNFQVELTLSSLNLPLEELEKKCRLFDERLEEIKTLRERAEDLITGDRDRTLKVLEEKVAALKDEAQKAILADLEGILKRAEGEKEILDAMSESVALFFEEAYHRVREEMDEVVTRKLADLTEEASRIIEEIRRIAVDLFALPPVTHPLPLFERERGALAWETHQWASSFSPVPEGFFDHFLPVSMRRKRRERRWREKVESLVMHNGEHLRWALYQGVNDTFRLFLSTFHETLDLAIHSTRGAIEETLKERREKGRHAGLEASRLTALRENLESLVS